MWIDIKELIRFDLFDEYYFSAYNIKPFKMED